jgi:hypothetical protein
MADAALLISWGVPARGREGKAVAVFGEAVAYWSGLQNQGQIESFETGLLEPVGGELAGFALLRGGAEQLARLRLTPDFQRVTTRAQLVVEDLSIAGVALGQRLADQMSLFQQQVADLT